MRDTLRKACEVCGAHYEAAYYGASSHPETMARRLTAYVLAENYGLTHQSIADGFHNASRTAIRQGAIWFKNNLADQGKAVGLLKEYKKRSR